MRIKYAIVTEAEGDFPTVDAFKDAHPNASIVLIDGWAKRVCEKGHPTYNEDWCQECHNLEPCPSCKVPNATCDCIPF